MQRYANRGGNSSVVGYSTTDDSITVRFKDGAEYFYDSVNPGAPAVNHMKSLAKRGEGLGGYISSVVRKNFRRKLR